MFLTILSVLKFQTTNNTNGISQGLQTFNVCEDEETKHEIHKISEICKTNILIGIEAQKWERWALRK